MSTPALFLGMATGLIPPQQQRSRETLARLLKATIGTLEQHGLKGATIPRIAHAAGVAPASVYRRFSDRDALLRAALIDSLRKGQARTQGLRLEAFRDRTFDGVVSQMVSTVMEQYRSKPGLMRAFTRFVENDSDDAFRSTALALVSQNFERFADILLAFRSEIGHKNQRRAVTFALLTMATVIEVRALERVSMWHELMPMSDRELHAEITKNFLAYLRLPRGKRRKTKRT
jgi:AcrR family transcriptional regulator